MFLKKNIYIHTVATGLLGSLPKCSTTLFTMVETVDGVKLLEGATVVEAMVAGLRVVLVVLTTISATCFAASLTTVVMLTAGSVMLATEEMTGTVEFSPNPS